MDQDNLEMKNYSMGVRGIPHMGATDSPIEKPKQLLKMVMVQSIENRAVKVMSKTIGGATRSKS